MLRLLLLYLAALCLSQAAAATEVSSEQELWSIHVQATAVSQLHGAFTSPYAGSNTMQAQPESKTSYTSTIFFGRRLWHGADVYINPELSAGSGLSATHGVAGYPNGEIYRVDSTDPKLSIARIFFRQEFDLGDELEKIEADKNELAGTKDSSRLTLVGGKFSLNDYFDNNSYSHDPRTQFLNWSLMDNGAWDYAADTRGYTWGIFVEWKNQTISIRFAEALEPKEANQLKYDYNIHSAHAENFEFEVRYSVSSHPGVTRFLAYDNHAHMGNYAQTLAVTPTNPDITTTRDYRNKYGFGLNLEQEVTANLGVFSRLGWNDGKTESWAFTEVEQTASLGVSMKGISWNRKEDVIGIAGIANSLSKDHRNYLQAGGTGFILGDGSLNYKQEKIIEAYYSLAIAKYFFLSPDYQRITNPGYNADRGPISIWALRAHGEF